MFLCGLNTTIRVFYLSKYIYNTSLTYTTSVEVAKTWVTSKGESKATH